MIFTKCPQSIKVWNICDSTSWNLSKNSDFYREKLQNRSRSAQKHKLTTYSPLSWLWKLQNELWGGVNGVRDAWGKLEGCLGKAWGVGPEDRYYNPKPQYTHSLIKPGSHTPETPKGVGGYINQTKFLIGGWSRLFELKLDQSIDLDAAKDLVMFVSPESLIFH